jgi:hypothetical protein
VWTGAGAGGAGRGSRKQASSAAANRARPMSRLVCMASTKAPSAARRLKKAVPMVAGPAAMPSCTTEDKGTDKAGRKSRIGPDPSAGREDRTGWGGPFDTARANRPSPKTESEDGAFRIPAGSRKAAMVHLSLES